MILRYIIVFSSIQISSGESNPKTLKSKIILAGKGNKKILKKIKQNLIERKSRHKKSKDGS